MNFDWGNAICVIVVLGMYIIAVIPFVVFVIGLNEKRDFK
jgi:hypothetical protein